MNMKILVSISIFILLFSAAWLLQQKNHEEFYVHKIELKTDPIMVAPLNVQASHVQEKRNTPFKPREYVRIIAS